MLKEDCFLVGWIVRKHGFKGDVIIKLDTDMPEQYEDMESIFLAQGEDLVPYFFERSSFTTTGFMKVHFEGVDTEFDADNIMKSELYLPMDFLPELNEDQYYYHEIVGWDVIDAKHGKIGVVKLVDDSSAQTLLIVDNDGTEIMIPHNQMVTNVDKDKKIVEVETPDGLLDLYL
ncbi:MAG: 16S rRNA processing protein RimM [Ichthyobacteriaceae bacterium]|nr:16S rRNA processing protein RimM [Ichthyobacteriaceae bacterium]